MGKVNYLNGRNGLRCGLMRPEITQYLVKITGELADILGIELDLRNEM